MRDSNRPHRMIDDPEPTYEGVWGKIRYSWRFGNLQTVFYGIALVGIFAFIMLCKHPGDREPYFNLKTGKFRPDCYAGEDNCVWVSDETGFYYFKGEKFYGNTKSGNFTTEQIAEDQDYKRPVVEVPSK